MKQESEAIQSVSGTVAGAPPRVFNPILVALEGRGARRRVSIVIYRLTGRQGFFYIPKKWCAECDLLVAMVQGAIRELGIEKAVDLKIRPWWLWGWLPLFAQGAWHAPILVIGGRVFSQGVVPDKEALKEHLRQELTR